MAEHFPSLCGCWFHPCTADTKLTKAGSSCAGSDPQAGGLAPCVPCHFWFSELHEPTGTALCLLHGLVFTPWLLWLKRTKRFWTVCGGHGELSLVLVFFFCLGLILICGQR